MALYGYEEKDTSFFDTKYYEKLVIDLLQK